MSDPERLLVRLDARHRAKLMTPKNLAKGTWLAMTDVDVFSRVHDEIAELGEALRLLSIGRGSGEEVANEAADVMHFAEMGADPERLRRRA